MTSNHSFFNLKFFKETFKQHYATISIVTLSFLVSLLLGVVAEIDSFKYKSGLDPTKVYDTYYINSFLNIDNDVLKSIMIGLGVVMGTLMFKYLHSKKQSDFFHSIPVSRKTLFFNNYFTGILIVVPAYLITVFMSSVYAKFSLGEFYSLATSDILIAILLNTTLFLLSYNTAVIGNILAGNTFIGAILSSLLIGSIDLISGLFQVLESEFDINSSNSIYSFTYNNPIDISIFKNAPIDNFFNINLYSNSYYNYSSDSFSSTLNPSNLQILSNTDIIAALISYLAVSVVLVGIGYFLFNKRGSETAGNCLSFDISKPIFKYLGVVIFSTIGSLFFAQLFSNKDVSIAIGLVILTILLHCMVEIIYDFDFKSIFKNFKSVFGCLLLSTILILGAKFDILNISDRISTLDKTESITILNVSSATNSIAPTVQHRGGSINIKEEENIENIINLHNSSLASDLSNEEKIKNLKYIELQYNLKNGSSFARKVYLTEETTPYLTNIINSDEYLDIAIIFRDESIKSYKPNSFTLLDTNLNMLNFDKDSDLINEFFEVLINDINKHGLLPSKDIPYQIKNTVFSFEFKEDVDLYNGNFLATYPETTISSSSSETSSNNKAVETLTAISTPNDIKLEGISDICIYKEYTDTINFIKNNFELDHYNLMTEPIEGISYMKYEYNGYRGVTTYGYSYKDYENENKTFKDNLDFILENSKVIFNDFEDKNSGGRINFFISDRVINITLYMEEEAFEILTEKLDLRF